MLSLFFFAVVCNHPSHQKKHGPRFFFRSLALSLSLLFPLPQNHAATDTFHGYKPFVDMIGGEFLKHGPQVEVDCLNCDHQHAAVKHLPASWTVFDEIYQFKNYEQKKVRDLLRLDKHPNDKTPGHYPVSWCKSFGTGKIFYTSLGHREDMWDPGYTDKQGRKNVPDIAKQYQAHVLGGLLWALGLAPGSSAPQAE